MATAIEAVRVKALATCNENSLHYFAVMGDRESLAAWQKIQRQKTTDRAAARLRVMEGGITLSDLNMTTTTTDTDSDRFQSAVATAIADAVKSRNVAILLAAKRRGFATELIKPQLSALFQAASREKDTGALKIFTMFNYDGAHQALNTAERARGLAQTPSLDSLAGMAAKSDVQDASREAFEKAALAAYNGDGTGLDRVHNARSFVDALARYDRARLEKVSDVAKSWPI
jgi:hypothetical protein